MVDQPVTPVLILEGVGALGQALHPLRTPLAPPRRLRGGERREGYAQGHHEAAR